MRAFVTIIILALGLGLRAQCPLNQAVDFTVTDIHGNEVHLFDLLDQGQHVLIDFFFTTCLPCQESSPFIAEAYYSFGCNQHDVFFMEISDRNNDEACLNWTNNFGVEYPTISGPGGGGSITHQYGISAWPTIILIAPDRSILIRDLWPIHSSQDVITALENQGIEPYLCPTNTTENPHPSIICYPNPADDFVTLKGENLGTVRLYNSFGQLIEVFESNGNELKINTKRYANGLYLIKTDQFVFRTLLNH